MILGVFDMEPPVGARRPAVRGKVGQPLSRRGRGWAKEPVGCRRMDAGRQGAGGGRAAAGSRREGLNMREISWDDFSKVELRVGRISRAEPFPQARKPAYILHVDFGPDIGLRKSSAPVTARSTPAGAVGRQGGPAVSLPPRQAA